MSAMMAAISLAIIGEDSVASGEQHDADEAKDERAPWRRRVERELEEAVIRMATANGLKATPSTA